VVNKAIVHARAPPSSRSAPSSNAPNYVPIYVAHQKLITTCEKFKHKTLLDSRRQLLIPLFAFRRLAAGLKIGSICQITSAPLKQSIVSAQFKLPATTDLQEGRLQVPMPQTNNIQSQTHFCYGFFKKGFLQNINYVAPVKISVCIFCQNSKLMTSFLTLPAQTSISGY
jgi:hypothetical protein